MLKIYKASAGSGKTYTLAYEYIKLVLGQKLSGHYVLNHQKYVRDGRVLYAPHERILAITFTNKATAEMKSRILKELEMLKDVPPDDVKDSEYAPRLIDEFGCTREELAEVAGKALRRLLADYGRFNVSTIDAFFQTVLRSFAREIDRQGDYRVEIGADMVLSEAMSMLLREVNQPEATRGIDEVASKEEVAAMRSWLEDRALSRVKDKSDYNPFDSSRGMFRNLINFLSKAFSETYSKYESAMNDYLADPKTFDEFVKGLEECKLRLVDTARQLGGDMLAVLDNKDINGNVISYWRKVAEQGEFCPTASGDWPAFFEKVESGIYDRVVNTSAKSRIAVYEPVLIDGIERAKRGRMAVNIISSVQKTINGVRAIAFISRYVDRYRRDNNLILLSDTNTLLNSIISESDAPFIFERVGAQLQNFMIDEFQDTSEQQWYHIDPLVRNSMGYDNDNLIIGDVKQSIYRWRGAKSDLLDHEVEDAYAGRHSVTGSRPGENVNYRSSHTVVRFNNTLFELLGNHPGLTPAITSPVPGYEGIAQELDRRTALYTGRVTYNGAGLDSEKKEEIAGEFGKADPSYCAAELIARNIYGQLERGYSQRDIAILVRGNAEAENIASYLQKVHPNINLVSEDALKLQSNQAVKKIVAALELIASGSPSLDPEVNRPVDDDAPMAELRKKVRRRRMRQMLLDCFNYYVAQGREVSDALRQALRQVRVSFPDPADTDPVVAPDEPVPFDGPDHDLREVRRRAPANLQALVEAVVDLKIALDEREANAQYIMAFIDIVIDFSRDNIPTLSSFLRYWHTKAESFVVGADSRHDAVTISTIHKAKGLEWRCVHVPLKKRKLRSAPGEEWYTTELLADYLSRETGHDPGTPPPLLYINSSGSFGEPGSPFKKQYDEHSDKSVIDILNLFYVAFTRAVRELDIYENCDGDKGIGELAAAITAAIDSPQASKLAAGNTMYLDFATELTERSDNYFAIGEPTMRDDEKENSSDTRKKRRDPMKPDGTRPLPKIDIKFSADNAVATRLVDVTNLAENEEDPAIAPEELFSDFTDPLPPSGTPQAKALENATRQGLELHSILSRMEVIDDLVDSLAFHRRHIPADRLAEHGETLQRIFAEASPVILSWFDPANNVLNEQPLFDPRSGYQKRIDRIAVTPDGRAIVVDYKFTTEQCESHIRQVRGYGRMLKRMGYTHVEAYLWYPLRGEVVSIEL